MIQDFHYPPPYWKSLICAVGMSQTLLRLIGDFAHTWGALVFIEAMYSTLAGKNNLKVCNPAALSGITWMQKKTCADFENEPLKWHHPVKNQTMVIQQCQERRGHRRMLETQNQRTQMKRGKRERETIVA